jgi:hypothetical protein
MNGSHPIIGVDILSYFGLLVDSRNNRLLDGVTSLSVSAQATSALIPSVKTIAGSTPIVSLQTILGPPVVCRPRRLAPDRLAISKADFDAMLREGTARRSESF